MTDDSQPAQGRSESTPALGSWWNEVHLQRTGVTTALGAGHREDVGPEHLGRHT